MYLSDQDSKGKRIINRHTGFFLSYSGKKNKKEKESKKKKE